ncbi:HesA/MoeB/ThiF family protein [uncultured Paraglaciecola sp.]|uniref:HesA/MoeB/ThiF family protein n=1 Tax=uncultured Paraglaciecola sp. TaxID=1765024 RepID=UPI0025990A5D|nr:HesA/MoeB/ThiF family protein [uncultured Paraglaciecola sp.]
MTIAATDILTKQQFIQYYRQILLPEVAEQGQKTLLSQHIMIVGVGGLGTHVAQQLAAAGIGNLYLVDDDKVENSNLPRQILFNPESIGQYKVSCAAAELIKLNPDVKVNTYAERFSKDFSESLFAGNSALKQANEDERFILLDCSDNMPTRQLLNHWCARHFIPLVSASVSAFSGQLMLIDGKNTPEAGCYHCVFSSLDIQQSCQSMGVLGTAVSLVASMQALTAMKLVLNIGALDKYLHIFDGVAMSWHKVMRHRDLKCPVCRHWPESNNTESVHSLALPSGETKL